MTKDYGSMATRRLPIAPPHYFGGPESHAERAFARRINVLKEQLGGGLIVEEFIDLLEDAVDDRIGEVVEYLEALPADRDFTCGADEWTDEEYEARVGLPRPGRARSEVLSS